MAELDRKTSKLATQTSTLRASLNRLRLAASGLRLNLPGRETQVRRPSLGFDSFESIPSHVLEAVALTYREVFAKPPWFETWAEAQVVDKLQSDLAHRQSLLTLLPGDRHRSVAGFAWGAVVDRTEVRERIAQAARVDSTQLPPTLIRRTRVLAIDELAMHPRFRRGLDPILSLLCPLVSLTKANRVGIVYWTKESARVLSITKAAGFSELTRVEGIRILWSPPTVTAGIQRSICSVPTRQAAGRLRRAGRRRQ